MSDYVFEINPAQYLYKANENKCYFVIHKCRLPGKNKDLFLIGDAFLRHFYSVYDFDQDQISLGVNVHSQGQVTMYKPGERPAEEQQVDIAATNATAAPAATSTTSTEASAVQTTAQSPEKKEVTAPADTKEVVAKTAEAGADSTEAKLPTDIDDTQIKSDLIKQKLSKITK